MAKPPFEPYLGDAEAAAGAGGKAKDQQATFDALKTNLSTQSDKASQQASGDIENSVNGSTYTPQGDAGAAAAAAMVGGASINHFAKAITTYNGHIVKLNERWEREKKNHFGVADDAGHEEGNTDQENDKAWQGKVDAARHALERELEEERKRYKGDLNDAGDYAASLLVAGPTRGTVLALVMTGDVNLTDAAAALGTTVSTLNQIRMWMATVNGGIALKDIVPALAQYLAGKDLNKITRGSMLKWDVKQRLRELVRENSKTSMTWDERVKAYKAEKARLRTEALRKSFKPGNYFGKAGYLPKHAKAGPLRNVLHHAGKVGRLLPWLGLAAGAYTVTDTLMNWEGTGDDWNNVVGGSSMVVSNGVAIALAAGVAVPGGIVVVGAVAGVIALGSLAYTYREEIAAGASWVYDKSGLDSVVNGATDLVTNIGDSLSDIDLPDIDLPDIDLPDIDMPW